MEKGSMLKWIAASAFLWLAPFATAAHASNILCTVIADGASGKVLRPQGTCDQRITAASGLRARADFLRELPGLLDSV
jgi:hypothetical protein